MRDFVISYVSSTSQFFNKTVSGVWLVASDRGNYNIYSISAEWTLKTEFLREWIKFHPIKIDAARDNLLKIECCRQWKRLHMPDLCDRKARAACAQSFALWQQGIIEFTRRDLVVTVNSYNQLFIKFTSIAGGHSRRSLRRDHSIIACSCLKYMVLFFAHIPFVANRAFQRNASGVVATVPWFVEAHRATMHQWRSKGGFGPRAALSGRQHFADYKLFVKAV